MLWDKLEILGAMSRFLLIFLKLGQQSIVVELGCEAVWVIQRAIFLSVAIGVKTLLQYCKGFCFKP